MLTKRPRFESKFNGSVNSLIEDITNACKQIHAQQLALFSEAPEKKAAYEALWKHLTTTRIIKQNNFISLDTLLIECKPLIYVQGLSENKHSMLEQVVRVYHAFCSHNYFLAGLKHEDTEASLAKKMSDLDAEINQFSALSSKDPLLQIHHSLSSELFVLIMQDFIEIFGLTLPVEMDVDIDRQKYINARFYKNMSNIRNGFKIISTTKSNSILEEEGEKLIKEIDILKKNLPEWFSLVIEKCKSHRDECLTVFASLEKHELTIQNILFNITQLEFDDLNKIGAAAKKIAKKQSFIPSDWDDNGEFIEEALFNISSNIQKLMKRFAGAHQSFASLQNIMQKMKMIVPLYQCLNTFFIEKDTLITACLSALETKRKYLVDVALNPLQKIDDFFSIEEKKEPIKVIDLDDLTEEDWEYLDEDDDYYSSIPDISPAQVAMLDAHYPERRFSLWRGVSQTISDGVSAVLGGHNNSGSKLK